MTEILMLLREKAREFRLADKAVDLHKIHRGMVILTTGMPKHPEGWDEPCGYDTCRSYAGDN